MKIILFSRPSEKSSALHFGALLESIEEHNFEWVVNSSTAEWLASKGVAEVAEEPAPEPQPKRRGRPRKNPEAEAEPAPEGAQPAVRRRSRAKKEESKELFPFYEQSLF